MRYSDCNAQIMMSERMHIRDSLQGLADNSWEQGRYEESIEYSRKICQLFADVQDGNNINHSTALYILGARQKTLKNHEDAIGNLEKALLIWEKVLPIPSETDIQMARTCEECCREMGDMRKAIEYGEKVLEKQHIINKEPTKEYLDDLFQLGENYFDCHEYHNALEMFSLFMNTITSENDTFGIDESFATSVLLLIGRCYYELEDLDRSRQCFEYIDSIYCNDTDMEKNAIITKNFLGLLYSQTDIEKATEYFDTAEELYFKHIDEYEEEENLKYFILRVWANKATLLTNSSLEEAKDIYNQILTYYEDGYVPFDETYAMVMGNKGVCLALLGDSLDLSSRLIDDAIEIIEQNDYEGTQMYLDLMTAKVYPVTALGNGDDITEYAKKLFSYISKQLANTFPILTEEERATYWNKVSGCYSRMIPVMMLHNPSPEMAALCYNGVLQSKGILLNSSVNIDRILKDSNNPGLYALRQQWSESKEQVKKAMENADEYEISYAQYLAKQLEKRILREIVDYGNFMTDLDINVDDVKNSLSDKDLAIEFLCSTTLDDSDTIYVALTLMKNYEAPHIIILGSNAHLQSIIQGKTLGGLDLDLFNSVWKPIIDDTDCDVESIFFSADGLLYNIPIEYCSMPDGGIIIDKYRCHRVSSTRELVRRDKHDDNKNKSGLGVLYGNIDYNANIQEIDQANEQARTEYGGADDTYLYAMQTTDLRNDRGVISSGFKYLRGTKYEINGIADIFKSARYPSIQFDSCRATKESLKMVANRHPTILHIATHGVYVSKEDKRRHKWLISAESEESQAYEDEMLSRSALIMAGANKYLSSNNAEDKNVGILTAREISLLDLSSLDMAVLSACETALGDVTGDGVFGLQRGFKKAGTNSLLMSLKKVDDHVTMLFMNNFYQQLSLKKLSKYDALVETIKYIRTTESNKWAAPQYWAAFILLDGIN